MGNKVTFEWYRLASPETGGSCLGDCRYDETARQSHIRLTPDYRPRLLTGIEWHTTVIETLLHEMCHAYLQLYACHGGRCNKSECPEQLHLDLDEEDGHGPAFYQLANGVEDAAKAHLGLRLSFKDAVGRE